MSPSELETLLLENPDKAHRLVLSSGDRVVVPNARSVSIQGYVMYVTKYVSPDRLVANGRTLVALENVVLAEMIDRPTPPPATRRGRRK